MKKILIGLLLLVTFSCAQDSTEVAVRLQMEELKKEYVQMSKLIKQAEKRKIEIEGAYRELNALLPENKEKKDVNKKP